MADPVQNGGFPRAPTEAQWAGMDEAERARVVESLPAAMTDGELSPPEGDVHRDAKIHAQDTLRTFFQRTGRKVYVAAEITVYYPGEDRFSPDVLAVLDVEPHDRMKWVVGAEGKGLDWVLEVTVSGSRRKDLERNVERYARLGIPEYFVFDRSRMALRGWALLSAGSRSYRPILAQAGRYPSRVLGLDLAIEDERLRFYHGSAALQGTAELIGRLERLVDQVQAHAEEESLRAEEESRRAGLESERADQEARRAREAEARVAQLLAEIEALRRRGS